MHKGKKRKRAFLLSDRNMILSSLNSNCYDFLSPTIVVHYLCSSYLKKYNNNMGSITMQILLLGMLNLMH